MSIASSHKKSKQEGYWTNLTQGITSQYKARMIDDLLQSHYRLKGERLLDVGCGTSEIIMHYRDKFKSKSAVCMDYDEKIVAKMKQLHGDAGLEFVVADIFELEPWSKSFDLIFTLDVIHEIYSVYGRADKDIKNQVQHSNGIIYVRKAFKALASLLEPGGGIVLTDNILPQGDFEVSFRPRTPAVQEAVGIFIKEFPTKSIPVKISAGKYTMMVRDFCILLTQYNKIKNSDLARWDVERLEIHQYMSQPEFAEAFDQLGFDCHFRIGTPEDSLVEWREDFELIDGLVDFPPKRVNLLAIKR